MNSFQQRDLFWVSFGRIVKNHFSKYNYEDNDTYSETLTDTMDDIDDIFDEFDGDFDIITINESGYDADSEDDD